MRIRKVTSESPLLYIQSNYIDTTSAIFETCIVAILDTCEYVLKEKPHKRAYISYIGIIARIPVFGESDMERPK